MPYYTTRKSLEVAYGIEEVAGLLAEDETNLDKACSDAQGEIDTYLHSAGYGLPLVFQPMEDSTPSNLPGLIQKCSDALTAWHLASSTDLHKKKYEEDRTAAIAYLEMLLTAKLRLVYPAGDAVTRTVPAEGAGMVVVARRSLDPDQRTYWCRGWPYRGPWQWPL